MSIIVHNDANKISKVNRQSYVEQCVELLRISTALNQETKMSIKNKEEIELKWIKIMRMEKCKELEEELTLLKCSFENAVDRKNHMIMQLYRCIGQSEIQRTLAYNQCLYFMNRLHFIYKLREKTYLTEFDNESQQICQYEFAAIEKDRLKYEKQLTDFQEIMLSLEYSHSQSYYKLLNDVLTEEGRIKKEFTFIKNKLRIQLENKVESIWKEYRTLRTLFVLKNESIHREIEIYSGSLSRSDKDNHFLNTKIRTITSGIGKYRKRLSNQFENFQQYKNDVISLILLLGGFRDKQRQKLKNRLASDCQKTKVLISHIESVRKRVNDLLKKAEKILRFAERCQKLQHEAEKATPFNGISLSFQEDYNCDENNSILLEKKNNNEFNKSDDNNNKYFNEFVTYEFDKSMELQKFWIRFNMAQLDVCALYKHREDLVKEKEELKLQLKNYLDKISQRQQLSTNFTLDVKTSSF